MTIRNIDAFIRSLPDWSIFDGCFGEGKRSMTDIDGMLERRGICIFVDHKMENGILEIGQAIAFEALSRQGNSCLVYWTDDPKKEHVIRIVTYHRGKMRILRNPSMTKLRACASRWYEKAEQRPWPKYDD